MTLAQGPPINTGQYFWVGGYWSLYTSLAENKIRLTFQKMCFFLYQASCQKRFREANLRCIGELEKRGREILFTTTTNSEDENLRRRQR